MDEGGTIYEKKYIGELSLYTAMPQDQAKRRLDLQEVAMINHNFPEILSHFITGETQSFNLKLYF